MHQDQYNYTQQLLILVNNGVTVTADLVGTLEYKYDDWSEHGDWLEQDDWLDPLSEEERAALRGLRDLIRARLEEAAHRAGADPAPRPHAGAGQPASSNTSETADVPPPPTSGPEYPSLRDGALGGGNNELEGFVGPSTVPRGWNVLSDAKFLPIHNTNSVTVPAI